MNNDTTDVLKNSAEILEAILVDIEQKVIDINSLLEQGANLVGALRAKS